MNGGQGISLIQEYETVIDTVLQHYHRNWLIFENSSCVEGLPFCEAELGRRYEQVWETERHNYTEIFMCIRGTCGIQLGDRIYDIEKGKVCLIVPDMLHSELSVMGQDYLGIWMAFDFSKLRLFLSGKRSDRNFFNLEGCLLEANYEDNYIMGIIRKEIEGDSPYRVEYIKNNVMRWMINTFRRTMDQFKSEYNPNRWKETIVQEVQKYIESHYTDHIRLADISQELCISANYLNTIFKSMTGITIINYLESYRMQQAQALLRETDLSIKQISKKLGYYDQYHFSKAFKKEHGLTPTQFRRKMGAS